MDKQVRKKTRLQGKTYHVIVDLDGTLCNSKWRQAYVQSKPKNWNAFYAGIPSDLPNFEVLALIKALAASGHTIVFVSGRPDTYRPETEAWLDRWCGDFSWDGPYMRGAGDNRDDTIIKQEIFDFLKREYPEAGEWFAIDDRDRVVAMWRANGIKCLQVDYGAF